MAFLRRTPTAGQPIGSPTDRPVDADRTADPTNEMALTRAGAAWVGVSVATVLAAFLITFLVENTHRVQVSFLGMSTSTSLALMLLIAAVGGVLITVVLGTARIVQLRRIIHRRGVQ
jgi:uncharacterized integral membrane protein